MDIKDMPAKFLKCENTGCQRPVAHIEVWNGHDAPPDHRFWCKEHTPWSGHYEYCGPGYKGIDQCAELMKEYAVRRDELLEKGELKP